MNICDCPSCRERPITRIYANKAMTELCPSWLAELATCWQDLISGDPVTGWYSTYNSGITGWINDQLAAETQPDFDYAY